MNKYRLNVIISITLIFALISGITGCQQANKDQTATYMKNTEPNITVLPENGAATLPENNSQALPKNDENLQGSNAPTNMLAHSNTVAERGDTRYFLSRDGDRSGYLTKTGLYLQGVNDTDAKRLVYDYIDNLQVAGDFVYYLKDRNQLFRINAKTEEPEPEFVQQGVDIYSLYDHWAYYWNKNDTFLYRLDLSNIQSAPEKMAELKQLDTLAARGDYVLAVERYRDTSSQKVVSTFRAWKFYPDGTKEVVLNIPQNQANLIQPYGDQIYYLEGNTIWCMDSSGKNKAPVYTPENSKINYFILYDNRIYTEERTEKEPRVYSSLDLLGKDKRLIFIYRGPGYAPPSSVNGTMDVVYMYRFNVTRDYLFLTGASYYMGEVLTTRVPIAGDAESKKEEIFFNGAWRPAQDYVKEAERVLTSKNLKW